MKTWSYSQVGGWGENLPEPICSTPLQYPHNFFLLKLHGWKKQGEPLCVKILNFPHNMKYKFKKINKNFIYYYLRHIACLHVHSRLPFVLQVCFPWWKIPYSGFSRDQHGSIQLTLKKSFSNFHKSKSGTCMIFPTVHINFDSFIT